MAAKSIIFIAPLASLLVIQHAIAQVDSVQLILNKTETVGGFGITSPPALAVHGYRPADSSDPLNPIPQSYFTAGFNSTAQDIRRIDVATDGTKTITRLLTNTAWVRFLKDGDLTRGGGAPTPGSLVLNKTAIPGSPIGAYGAAFIADNAGKITTAGADNLDLTRRIYRYNLALDANGDGREEFTSLVTLDQMRQVTGATSTSSNLSRQVALSSDSSTVYFVDASAVTAFGGLWKVNALGGGLARVLPDDTVNIEPAVINVGGTDRVFINGGLTSPGGSNVGGLDYYDAADGIRKVGLAVQTLATFLETTADKISTQSATSDADGNIYFSQNTSTAPDRRGIYKLDSEGRLIKIASYAERNAAVSAAVPGQTAIGSSLRLQSHVGSFTGPNGAFDLTQLTYNESSVNVSGVAGVNVFKPGDFNRDNAYTPADGLLFGAKLTPMANVTLIPVADSRYDLNGNNLANYRDVKILQTFLGFLDGDANFDLTVDFADLVILAQNYDEASKTWFTGDFDGNDAVDFQDLIKLAQNYNGSAIAPIEGGAGFATDWALAQTLVPEPASVLGVIYAAGMLGFRRRRRNR